MSCFFPRIFVIIQKINYIFKSGDKQKNRSTSLWHITSNINIRHKTNNLTLTLIPLARLLLKSYLVTMVILSFMLNVPLQSCKREIITID